MKRFHDAHGRPYEVAEAPPLERETPFGRMPDWSLDNAIHRHVLEVLATCQGDLAWAASELGISTSTLWKYRQRWASADAGARREPRPRLQLASAGAQEVA